jgi:hypothetical protein
VLILVLVLVLENLRAELRKSLLIHHNRSNRSNRQTRRSEDMLSIEHEDEHEHEDDLAGGYPAF